MKNNEIQITFQTDKDLIEKFDKAADRLAATMHLGHITRKQALSVALQDAVDKWGKEPSIE